MIIMTDNEVQLAIIALSSVIIGCLLIISVGLLIVFMLMLHKRRAGNPTQQV